MSSYPNLTAPEGGYVFLVTYGRSGSTLLQSLLNSIPGYCIRGENNNALFHMAEAWRAIEEAEPMRGMRKVGAPSTHADPWYGGEKVDPDHIGRALADLFVRDVLQPPAGTRVTGFKEIRFHKARPEPLKYFTYLARHFPKAKFVFNTRDHAATRTSGWWAQMEEADVLAELREAERAFTAAREMLGGAAITLHYEDYVADPEALRPLFEFLGESYSERLIASVMRRKLTHLKSASE